MLRRKRGAKRRGRRRREGEEEESDCLGAKMEMWGRERMDRTEDTNLQLQTRQFDISRNVDV